MIVVVCGSGEVEATIACRQDENRCIDVTSMLSQAAFIWIREAVGSTDGRLDPSGRQVKLSDASAHVAALTESLVPAPLLPQFTERADRADQVSAQFTLESVLLI